MKLNSACQSINKLIFSVMVSIFYIIIFTSVAIWATYTGLITEAPLIRKHIPTPSVKSRQHNWGPSKKKLSRHAPIDCSITLVEHSCYSVLLSTELLFIGVFLWYIDVHIYTLCIETERHTGQHYIILIHSDVAPSRSLDRFIVQLAVKVHHYRLTDHSIY